MIKLLVRYSFPLPCYLFPLRPKYLPQRPILEHPQPMFLPPCERASFTPSQHTVRTYNFAHFTSSYCIYSYWRL